jgi:hypothetical protein
VFQNHGIYRHSSTLDIDLVVLRIQYCGAKATKMRVCILNRHWNGGNFVTLPNMAVEISTSDMGKWKLVGWSTHAGRVSI